ncbi:hypothetical protein GOODEAATRI_034629 [Goodea atripinnis]|uniref:MHC class I antigen n=1 Tax=Goodea atripinnis TaxID=208336 RepID=A0ABV0MXH6_9TELE
MKPHSCREVEANAHSLLFPDTDHFSLHAQDIGDALRELYPVTRGRTIPKFEWNPNTNPREYLDQCKSMWQTQTGTNPANEGSQRDWFRDAVLRGLPTHV